ncbi:MAG: Asp-tRNA(Asn)/Glu-tRNA(Gln) amidotransferase subunit GatA [Desulfovibrionales bacterium]
MSEAYRLTLQELREKLHTREISAAEAVRSCLERIERTEPQVSALLAVTAEQALTTATAMDRNGPDPAKPLWGIPLVVKDVLTTRDVPTTCGSKLLENFVPFYDAHVVEKLKNAGAVILAKSNMDEFAMGSSTENSAYAATKNPWDLGRVPGGSSGGSAASVASCQCPGALGTDTGGSIRQPASFCGIVGMKPTYGRVSRFGMVAFGSSLDQIGPLTRTVGDNATLLQAIAGYDPKDSTSVNREVPDYEALLAGQKDLSGLTIGVPEEFWGEGMTPEVEKASQDFLNLVRELGGKTVPLSMPHTPYGIAAYYIIAPAEASSNLARYDGVRYGLRDKEADDLIDMYVRSRSKGFGDEVQRRIMLGTYVLSSGYYDAYYRKAAQVRRLLRQDFDQALEHCDLIAAPASPSTAFRLGELTEDPLQMYLMDVFTIPLNLTGLPGICFPVGLGRDSGLPVGMQLFGPAFQEDLLYQASAAVEASLPALPRPGGLD